MTSSGEAKPDKSGEIQHINLKVKGADGTEIAFKIKRSTTLQRLMDAYTSKTGVDKNSIRFMFDGKRLLGTETPDMLEMEDGDMISTAVTQIGGWCSH
ncbi:ubiquitin-related domain-containing protein [Zopfochytrium polystomum]|nr:ubiquitin-related domain-containing protein [Zopfochytrium polystomum]